MGPNGNRPGRPLACVIGLLAFLAVVVGLGAAALPAAYAQTVGGVPKPTAEVAQPGGTSDETERLLAAIQVPVRDRLDLARRFRLSEEPVPAVVNSSRPSFTLGEKLSFWVGETDTQRHFEAIASLRYIGAHSYWWIQEGYDVRDEEVKASAKVFEDRIYPTNRAFFGSEWSPGVDNDPRIHIFIGNVPGVGGYFYSVNEYSRLINPYSNEKEMFFINIEAARPGTDNLASILAHEFQHMIHWRSDANEDTWVNEGLSELAMKLNGYNTGGVVTAFTSAPDTQLTAWGDTPDESIAHYGASYLFMAYFLERFGEDITRRLVAEPANGANGFNAVLEAAGRPERFDDIFADWVIANYLDDPGANQGYWGYTELDLGPVKVDAEHSAYPVERQATVGQYATDYVVLNGEGNLTIEFTGQRQVKIAANAAHSGRYQWWSNRGDDSDMTLTRRFDLSEVKQATLSFWVWYDIEEGWDYAYVEASTDGGQTWHILPGRYTTTENRSGNNFGHGWTGRSGAGETAEWVQEQVDLSPYAGGQVDIRFEYLTDDAVNRPGFLLDDIAIPEIGYWDDVEAGEDGWVANGFARIDNVLPQRYLVQLIEVGDSVRVRRMALDATNSGQLSVEDLGERLDYAVLTISGKTPFTTETASYTYRIYPAP